MSAQHCRRFHCCSGSVAQAPMYSSFAECFPAARRLHTCSVSAPAAKMLLYRDSRVRPLLRELHCVGGTAHEHATHRLPLSVVFEFNFPSPNSSQPDGFLFCCYNLHAFSLFLSSLSVFDRSFLYNYTSLELYENLQQTSLLSNGRVHEHPCRLPSL